MLHPKHDEVAASVSAANRAAFPDMGWHVQRFPFGWLKWHEGDPDLRWAWIVLEHDVADADSLLTSLGAEFVSWAQLRLRIDHAPQREQLAAGQDSGGTERVIPCPNHGGTR